MLREDYETLKNFIGEKFKEYWNSMSFLRGYFVGSSIGYLILFLYNNDSVQL